MPSAVNRRIEHEDWECPACRAKGDCWECGGLGTREAYDAVQDLHQHAIDHPGGIAALVLEKIALWPGGCQSAPYWVERMILGAQRQIALERN